MSGTSAQRSPFHIFPSCPPKRFQAWPLIPEQPELHWMRMSKKQDKDEAQPYRYMGVCSVLESCLCTQQGNSPICKENEQIHLALISTARRLFCQVPIYSRCLINISVKLPPITISRDIFLCFSDFLT